MIKVYLDWNVISGMKQGHQPDFVEILNRKDQFQVIYSTSHISDILVSYNGKEEQNAIINEDLEYISSLTNNTCASIVKDKAVIEVYDPKAMFDYRVESRNYLNGEGLFDSFLRDYEPDSPVYQAITKLLELPVPTLLSEVLNNPNTASAMNQYYPVLADNPTFGHLINVTWKRIRALNENESYKELRNTLQTGLDIKPNQLFNAHANPFDEIDKRHKRLEKRTGAKMAHAIANSGEYSPPWFQEIYGNYIKLDMHGYQEDRIRVDDKHKETMRNTIDDGFHAAFASMCNFYITSDKKSSWKTKQVFKKLDINTTVLTPTEFIDYYNIYLKYNDISEHIQLWLDLINSDQYISTEEKAGQLFTFNLNHFLFDYFNRGYILQSESGTSILLTQSKPTNNALVSNVEIANVANKLNYIFGVDKVIDASDINFENPIRYEWKLGKLIYTLVLINNYLQLYLDVEAP